MNFEPTGMSEGTLTSEFKGSILRLQTSGSQDSGTGYLIDSTQGYLITAFHVIASDSNAPSIDVTSPDPRLAGVKLTAKLMRSIGTLQPDGTVGLPDLALLKLDNPLLVKNLRAVDISLRYPSVDQTFYAMGYPKLGDLPNTTFSEQLVRFMASPEDGSIQVTQATFGGNSGGPLLDPTGSVLGTCHEVVGTGSVVARYTPMSDAETLLDLIPLTERTKVLDDQVKTGSITETAFKALLIKNSTNPTNLELYTWARYINAHRDLYSSIATKKLLQCSMRAFSQRGMEDLVIALSSFADPRTVGDANITLAEREINQGRPLAAESHVLAAAVAYAAANDSSGQLKASMLSTRLQLAVGSIDSAAMQSAALLEHLSSFPPADRATALTVAAHVDIARGNGLAAVQKLNAASEFSVQAGQPITAANLLSTSADVSLEINKPHDAMEFLARAISLYKNSSDKSGEAESIYKLVKVESALGDQKATTENLQHYLALEPEGSHSAEAREILRSTDNVQLPKVTIPD